MQNLILITNCFPFGKFSEAFLETEINYLALKFDTIYIIATKPDSSFIRPVPKNTIIFMFPNNRLIGRSLGIIFKHGYLIAKYAFYEIPHTFTIKDRNILKRFKELVKHLIKAFMIEEFIVNTLALNKHRFCIYSYWFNSAAFTAGLLKMNYKGLKAVSRLHNWDLYIESNDIGYFPLQRNKALLLDKCFFISDQGRQYFERKFVKLSSFSVSKLGVRKQDISLNNPDNNVFNIVSCSFLHEGKRVDYIIESLALINEINISWTHLGGGEQYEELINLALTRLGDKNNISYKFTGNILNSEIIQFYRENYIHLFINTSKNEGLPVSIMEAMSFGIPVIATDTGGTSEIVNKTCGILLNNNCTYDEIKSGILKIYNNYLVFPYRQNAYENWEKNFNADINYKMFADEISSMI